MPLSLETLPGKEVLLDTMVSSSIWKLLCIILILANFKNLPLIWHVSTYYFIPSILRLLKSSTPGSVAQCFPLCTPIRTI